jgi:tetratricopeptide (TPR) repeat protein
MPACLEIAISAVLKRQTDPDCGTSTAERMVAVAETHRAAGRLDKAETSLRKHLRAHPRDAKSLHVLGLIARDKGRHDRAIQLLDKAVAAAPMAPDILCDFALALKAAGRHEEAISAQARVTELLPNSAPAWSNHGTALTAAKRFDDAIVSFTRALSLEPNTAELHYNLGNATLALGDPEGAEAAFIRTLEISPGHAGGLENLSCALKEQGRLAEAEDLLRSACALYPDNSDLRWNHALALLMSENYREGWPAYEARRAMPGFAIKPQSLPPWNGSDLAGRRLLVHAEQGFGDTIQFCRYLDRLSNRERNIVFQVPPRLLPLMRSLTTNAEITDNAKAAARCDVEAPLLSLPHLLGPCEPFWPKGGAYLTPDTDRIARWKERLEKERLAGQDGLSIAIAWQGDPGYRADKTRSIPLAAFAPLAELPGIRLISLQQGPGCSQIRDVNWRDRILALGDDIDRDGAFLDSAAILANVDLMISSDTALAHLAGAAGVPVWLALSRIPDWRWGAGGDTCGWYPSLRLFRQETPGDWHSVFKNIATSIKEKLA